MSAAFTTPVTAETGYPIGAECSKAEAVLREKKTLEPRSSWPEARSVRQRLSVRVPKEVFKVSDAVSGFELVSALRAPGLGENAKDHVFTIRIRRLPKGVQELVADTSKSSPLAFAMVDLAFPKRTVESFVGKVEDSIGSGARMRTSIAEKQAWMWVNGVEGYNTDVALAEIGPHETLLIVADWSSAIMGQPECFERQVIGGVVRSVKLE